MSCLHDLGWFSDDARDCLRIPRRSRKNVHHLVGEPTTPEPVGHEIHDAIDVGEERKVSVAEVVQGGFAIGRARKALLRAFAVDALEP